MTKKGAQRAPFFMVLSLRGSLGNRQASKRVIAINPLGRLQPVKRASLPKINIYVRICSQTI